jgi:hypothetical protein
MTKSVMSRGLGLCGEPLGYYASGQASIRMQGTEAIASAYVYKKASASTSV